MEMLYVLDAIERLQIFQQKSEVNKEEWAGLTKSYLFIQQGTV